MVNLHRGEIEAQINDKTYTLCLTLGALAELENTFGEADMLAVAERFQSGRLKSSDAIKILGAGLRGAGYHLADEDVAIMSTQGGAIGFVHIVSRLLQATFASGDTPDDAVPSGEIN